MKSLLYDSYVYLILECYCLRITYLKSVHLFIATSIVTAWLKIYD